MSTNPTPPPASLTFVPWVRQGVTTAITKDDTLGSQQAGVVDISASLTVNGEATTRVSMAVRLRGPADVVGIDANQIIRMDPQPGTIDFEPTYFPCVEFDRADFPWLFTPARADATGTGKLRPWLCLVVVRNQDGVTLGSSTVDAPLPTLRIAPPANPGIELPNLVDSWAWAHAQAAASDSTEGPVRTALDGAPELSLSRLLCPRILAPDTDYLACVVPTFELGRKAGLGLPVLVSDLAVLAPAWSLVPAPPVLLPVYHHWEFRTGVGGDFASLVGRLRPNPAPPGLGRRPIDISRPGFATTPPIPARTTLEVEGALQPILPAGRPDTMAPWPDITAVPFQDALAPILNAPGVSAVVDPGADPLLAPPLYGRWDASNPTVTRTRTDWFGKLNLDPRLRSVAAFGTRVIQEHQEALMASAWEQAGALRLLNQRLRQLQVSLSVGVSLHARHFSGLSADLSGRSAEAALRFTAPVLGRIGLLAAATQGSQPIVMVGSGIPLPALSPAMRRIGRVRGPVTRRSSAQGAPRSPTRTWVVALNDGTASLPAPTWFDLLTITAIRTHMDGQPILAYSAVTAQVMAHRGGVPWFVVRAEGQPVPIVFSYVHGLPSQAAIFDSRSARAFRRAAVDHLFRVNPGRAGVSVSFVAPPAMGGITAILKQKTQPRQTVAALAQRVVAGETAVPESRALRVGSASTDTIMVAPSFPHPMYEPLRDLSQDLLLPGVDAVAPDTVLGLTTNRRFVEAYLVGLNFEMGRELLWRGFPTDQRGTYFDQFWGGGADIEPLHLWGERTLGGAPTTVLRDKFVMLLRSGLLRRYRDAVIYLAPAVFTGNGVRVPSEANEKLPVFSGTMPPDINFLGFDVTAEEVITAGSGAGYYLVIQEHPTEPRFGLHTGVSVGSASHVAVGTSPPAGQPLHGSMWGLNAAHMAGIVRRLPVRLAIHASLFLTPTPADPQS